MSLGNCDLCKFPFRLEYDYDLDAKVQRCSEFCAELTSADKQKFKSLQFDDFGLYPCAECGCIIEDTYVPDGICGDCTPVRLLRQCLAELVEPSALATEVREYIIAHSPKGA